LYSTSSRAAVDIATCIRFIRRYFCVTYFLCVARRFNSATSADSAGIIGRSAPENFMEETQVISIAFDKAITGYCGGDRLDYGA